MRHTFLTVFALGLLAAQGSAQDYIIGGPACGGWEPVYAFDDQEVWKHGSLQIIPYYGGHQTFRPHNYKHVFKQSAQAAAWGMPPHLPYSQTFDNRYVPVLDQSVPTPSAAQPMRFGPYRLTRQPAR